MYPPKSPPREPHLHIGGDVAHCLKHKSMSLKYEPSSEQVHLGGLIPDYWDKRILTAYINRVCSEEFLSRKTATLFGTKKTLLSYLNILFFFIIIQLDTGTSAS